MSIDDLLRLADAQGGVFTTADAQACGISRSALRHRLATGEWRRLRRGVFADSTACTAPVAYAETPALSAVAAALAAVGPGAVASHHSAALLLGLATYGRTPGWVAVTMPRRRVATCESLPDLRARRSVLPDEGVWEVGGLPVTSSARTAVDVARGASLRGGVVVLDAALRAGSSLEELAPSLLGNVAGRASARLGTHWALQTPEASRRWSPWLTCASTRPACRDPSRRSCSTTIKG